MPPEPLRSGEAPRPGEAPRGSPVRPLAASTHGAQSRGRAPPSPVAQRGRRGGGRALLSRAPSARPPRWAPTARGRGATHHDASRVVRVTARDVVPASRITLSSAPRLKHHASRCPAPRGLGHLRGIGWGIDERRRRAPPGGRPGARPPSPAQHGSPPAPLPPGPPPASSDADRTPGGPDRAHYTGRRRAGGGGPSESQRSPPGRAGKKTFSLT